MSAIYKVMVDDNFHYMDKSERYVAGTYATADETLKKCKQIVDEYLASAYSADMDAKKLYQSYAGFGEDPFIVVEGATDDPVRFSSCEYAKLRCEEIAQNTWSNY